MARLTVPPEMLSEQTQCFMDLLNTGSDTAAIVVGTGYIDACLASLLAKKLRRCSTSVELLDSRSGAIGSFAVRAKVAYAMALITKPLFQDLQVLAELRNVVAHHYLELSFEEPAVSSQCVKLMCAVSLFDDPQDDHHGLARILETSSRSRFTVTAVVIAQRLLVDALGTSSLAA